MGRIFHFRFCVVFIKVNIYVQWEAYSLWLIIPFKFKNIVFPDLWFLRCNKKQELLRFSDALCELHITKNWPGDELFNGGKFEVLRTSVFSIFKQVFKGTVMQIEKALINGGLCVSKVSWKFHIPTFSNFKP